MHKLVVLLAATVTLGIGVGTTQVASAGSRQGGDLVLTEKVKKFTQGDLGKKGVSQGDPLVYNSDLLDGRGNTVGRSVCECVVITPKGEDLGLTNCQTTYQLKGGQIVMQGIFDLSSTSNEMAVTGGTGRYAGKTGEVEFFTKSEDTFVATFHLRD